MTTLLPKARVGDAVARTYVGGIYEKGLGMSTPDYASAVQRYQKAAASNHAPAQTSLGSQCERGLGVPKDDLKALTLSRQAAGLADDKLIFESKLEQERSAFRKEIALRNPWPHHCLSNYRTRMQRTSRVSLSCVASG